MVNYGQGSNIHINGYIVTLSGLAIGDVLQFNGTAWANTPNGSGDPPDNATITTTVGGALQVNLANANTWTGLQTFSAGAAFTGTSPSITKYNNIATAGAGVPFIVASFATSTVTTTQTNAINYTPPAAAGRYRISVIINNTSSTNTGTNTVTVTYANSNGTSISQTVALQSTAGSFGTTSTGTSTTFFGEALLSTDNSQTAITLTSTVAGSASAQISGTLEQLA